MRRDDSNYFFLLEQGGGGGLGPRRTGPVRLEHRCFADDQGAWNPLGASLFWSIWGERNDPDRLDKNLAYLAGNGFDFYRGLSMVGAPSWWDRKIDPYAPDHWLVLEKLCARTRSHGLRIHQTIFADAQDMMPNKSDRRAYVADMADFTAQHADAFLSAEIVNEYPFNGFQGMESDIRELAAIFADRSPVAIALSSAHAEPWSTHPTPWEALYTGSRATLCAQHYDRDVSRADGYWRCVRQPWGYPGEYVSPDEPVSNLPTASINQEPIGPDSSVSSDFDPMRVAGLAFATTVVSGNGAHVYHCGGGIRGGGQADLDKGRKANIYDYPQELADSFRVVKSLLPAGIPNWTRHNSQWASCPINGFQVGVEQGKLMRFYCATAGNQMVGTVLGIKAPVMVSARQGMDFALVNPLDGATLEQVSLNSGNSWECPANQEGYLLLGTLR